MLTLFKFINFYYLRSRPLKMLLTLLGMTAGIAVFAAIQIANQSVLFPCKTPCTNCEALATSASLETSDPRRTTIF